MATQNCTLTYTISAKSEHCRTFLEEALAAAGWKKTENEQQTHWTGSADESLFVFIDPDDNKKKWDHKKIGKMFAGYFSALEAKKLVDVIFVLQAGNLGGRAITVSGTTPSLSVSVEAIKKG